MGEPVVPVILAGGVGARLWPVSRTYYPKQFHRLLGEHSFIQQTVLRAREVTGEAPIVVCNEEHRFMVAEQLRAIGVGWHKLILEPEGRSSAPAIALAAVCALEKDANSVLLVLPSDHLIEDQAAFKAAVKVAAQGAKKGGLVTFGVQPDRPETGYGYIQVANGQGGLQAVASFVEKPQLAVAQDYLASGNYLWNSGMFVLSAQSYMDELSEFQPQMAAACTEAMHNASTDMDFLRPSDAFLASPSDSIDFAVMEKTAHAMVVPVDFGWNDIGAWDAIFAESERDAEGNHFRGDVISIDTTDSLVIGGKRLIGTVGLKDVIIVDTADAVLVADRSRVQDVKAIVAQLASDDREEPHYHTEVFRPWGSYEGLVDGERYQVKCIRVKPGASLSLQLHHHRSEHWVVVKGAGRITRGEESFILSENQSTYIPQGVKHRLENPGAQELELIEVQVGSYLGEDDIERFDDVYGR